MKTKLVLLFWLCSMFGVYADPPAPMPVEINSQSRLAPELWAFRANQRTYRATFKDGTNTVDVTGATFFMSWSTNELSSSVITATWAVVSTTGGVVDFTFVASRLNYALQTNIYEIGVNDSNGALAAYNRGRFLIKPSPFATGTNVVPFTTNFNMAGYAFVNQPWVENLTVSTSGSAFVWSGTGTTRNLAVPTGLGGGSGTHTNLVSTFPGIVISNPAGPNVILTVQTSTLATAVQGSYATGTPLYVEADTQAIAQVGVVSGLVDSVEAYTNRAAAALASSVWASALSTTGSALLTDFISTSSVFEARFDVLEPYTSRVVGTEAYTARAAIALSSSVWNSADATTNYAPRTGWITTNAAFETRIDVVESFTDRTVAVEGYTNRSASALASSVWAASESTTGFALRTGFIATSLVFETRIALLEGSTNFNTGLAAYTNRAAGALQSNVWALAPSTTNAAPLNSWITTNANNESRIDVVESYTDRVIAVEGYTNRAASALASSVWASADSTTGYAPRLNWITTNAATAARIGLEETNRIALGAIVTNDIVALGAVTTATLNNVTTTNTQAQRVLADFQAGGLLASSNVIAASTNDAMSTNMLVNGDMALGGMHWVFGGGANSNVSQMIVSAGTSGTAQQSNQFNATAGPWLLSYTNNDPPSTGSIVVSFGGVDHTQAGNLTGFVSWIVGPRNTNGWSLTAVSTNGLISMDSFSLKQIKTGNVTGVYGSFDKLTASSIVAVTISGTLLGNASETQGLSSVLSFGQTARLPISLLTNAIVFQGAAGENLHMRTVNANDIIITNDTGGTDATIQANRFRAGSGANGSVELTDQLNGAGLSDSFNETEIATYATNGTYTYGDGGLTISNQLLRGNGSGLTNITATVTGAVHSISKTGAVSQALTFSGAGVLQTNQDFHFPEPVQTGGVVSVAVTGAVKGAIQLDAGSNVALTQTNTTLNISFTSAILTGQVNQIGATGAVRGSIGLASGTGITITQADTNFSFAQSYQPTGAVLSLSNTGAVKGAITFAGNAVTQTNGIFNFLDTAGSGIGIHSNGTVVATVTNINFVGSGIGQITGDTVNISGGAGGTGTFYSVNAFAGPALTVTGDTSMAITMTGAVLNLRSTASGGTRAFQGFGIDMQDITGTNQNWASGTWTQINLVVTSADVFTNTGNYIDPTNSTFSTTACVFQVYGSVYSAAAGAGGYQIAIIPNGFTPYATNVSYGPYKAFEGGLGYALSCAAGSAAQAGISLSGTFVSTGATTWKVWGYQASGSSSYRPYKMMFGIREVAP